MSNGMPAIPAGDGKHPVGLVVISANSMADSAAFYSKIFGWQTMAMSAELTAVVTPAGPTVALRANVPEGFPGLVPYLVVTDAKGALDKAVAAGATIERPPFSVPMVGKLARFKEQSGTIYGVMEAMMPGEMPAMPMPFGDNPKPPVGALCSLEMYAASGDTVAKFFGDLFGWGSIPTMPQFVGFDPGRGISGVWQSHTPALPAVAYIYVANVAAKLTEIEAAGGARLGDAMSVPGLGTFGYFRDPSGTSMGMIGG